MKKEAQVAKLACNSLWKRVMGKKEEKKTKSPVDTKTLGLLTTTCLHLFVDILLAGNKIYILCELTGDLSATVTKFPTSNSILWQAPWLESLKTDQHQLCSGRLVRTTQRHIGIFTWEGYVQIFSVSSSFYTGGTWIQKS